MYSLVSAIGKTSGRWASVEIGSQPLNKLFSDYQEVKAILSNPFITGNVCLTLSGYRTTLAGMTSTFNEWLASLGNKALSTSTELPVLNPKFVKYVDGFAAGYDIKPTGLLSSPDFYLPAADATTLFLSKEGVDFNLFCKRCMVSVNGYFHYVDSSNLGAWVHEGMKTCYHSGENQLGIHSFGEIADIKYKAITADMLHKTSSSQEFRHRTLINIGEDVSDKTVILVLGGYMHVMDKKDVFLVSDQMLCVSV